MQGASCGHGGSSPYTPFSANSIQRHDLPRPVDGKVDECFFEIAKIHDCPDLVWPVVAETPQFVEQVGRRVLPDQVASLQRIAGEVE